MSDIFILCDHVSEICLEKHGYDKEKFYADHP